MTTQYEPYTRTSEAGTWGIESGNGQLGKPGRYEDPDLWARLSSAFAPLFSPDVRMQEDANAATEQGVTQPPKWYAGLVSPFMESQQKWTASTANFLGTVTTTWTDPDTGKFYFGSGPEVGQQINTTASAFGNLWTGMRGLFNTAYPPDPGAEPTANPMPGQQTPAQSSIGLLILIGLGLWLWSK